MSLLYQSILKSIALALASALFLLAAAKVARAEVSELLDRANNAYSSGNFSDAAELYQEAVAQGFENSSLYYNLGTSYLQSKQLGLARLNLLKAIEIDPHNEDARGNLAQLQRLAAAEHIAAPTSSSGSLTMFLNRQLGVYRLRYALILSALLAIGLLLAQPLLSSQVFAYSFGISILLVSWLFVSVFYVNLTPSGTHSLALGEHRTRAIVLTPETSVYSSKDPSSQVISILTDGEVVEVASQRKENPNNGWIQLALPSGRKGWVSTANIGKI